MPNVAFHHEVLSLVRKSSSALPLPAGGDPKFAELGAIGPDLYQYIPVSTALAKALDKSFKTALATGGAPTIASIVSDPVLGPELQKVPMMAIYSLVCQEIVEPFWPHFHNEAKILAELAPIAAAQNNGKLQALGGIAVIDTDAKALGKLPPVISTMIQMIPLLLEFAPPIEAPSSSPTAKPWDPTTGRPAEFLRWHHTNKLAQTLFSSATTADQKTYAYGYLCHMAGAVCGEPFINTVVGGPYRTHWWRNRFVANFVDSWTFGRYEPPIGMNPQASMSGDTPTPTYPNWPDITQSNLQANFDVAGFAPANADLIPEAVRRVGVGLDAGDAFLTFNANATGVLNYVHSAITSTYPLLRPPDFINDPIAKALVGLYGVVWVMTSGFTTPPPLPAPPPGGAENPPSWVNTSGGTPPPPVQGGPSTGATVCGVLLAILSALAFAAADLAGGSAALAGAIAEFDSGHGIDWAAVQNDVFWLTMTLTNIQQALFTSLALGGVGYPMPSMLGGNSSGSWEPVTPAMLGVVFKNAGVGEPDNHPLTRLSHRETDASDYPAQMDQTPPVAGSTLGADAFYSWYPGVLGGDNTQIEQPPVSEFPPTKTVNPSADFVPASLYPDLVVDQSPAVGQGIFTLPTFPSDNEYFGDSLSNALLLLAQTPGKLPDYNLDGDRGYGWLNWNPQAPGIPVHLHPGNYPSSGTVVVVPE